MGVRLGAAGSGSLTIRFMRSGEDFARALGVRIPRDSIYNTLQRVLEAEEAVAQTLAYLNELGGFNAVTSADVARYDSARINLFSAELSLFVELNTNRGIQAALTAGNMTLPVPLMQPAYAGPVRTSSMREELRLEARSLSGLGATPPPPPPPVFWAALALAALAIVGAVVVASIFLTSDTAGRVAGTVVMAASARLASYQRLMGTVACNTRYPSDAVARQACIDQVIQAVPIQEDYRLLLAGGPASASTWILWILAGAALTVGGYYAYKHYIAPRKFFKGISGPRSALSVGSAPPRAKQLPRATMNRRKDRYSQGGSLRVGR